MTVKEFLSYDCPTAKPDHFPADVLDLMSNFKIKQIPYANQTEYIALLEEVQLDELDFSLPLHAQLKQPFFNPFCLENQHVLEIIPVFGHQCLTLLPVLNDQQQYVGSVMAEDILAAFGSTLSPSNNGGIIVLQVAAYNYSLVQISQIIESNDAKILQLFVTESTEKGFLEITIKVNQEYISGILQTFARYNYQVKAVFSSSADPEGMTQRYELLMRLLNV